MGYLERDMECINVIIAQTKPLPNARFCFHERLSVFEHRGWPRQTLTKFPVPSVTLRVNIHNIRYEIRV